MSYRGYPLDEDQDIEYEDAVLRTLTDPDSDQVIQTKITGTSTQSLCTKSKREHIKDLSSQIFQILHEKTASTHDPKLEGFLDDGIVNKRDKEKYLDHGHDNDDNTGKRQLKNGDNKHLLPSSDLLNVASNSNLTQSSMESPEMTADSMDAGDLALQLADSEIERIMSDIDDIDGIDSIVQDIESENEDENGNNNNLKVNVTPNSKDTFIITDQYYEENEEQDVIMTDDEQP